VGIPSQGEIAMVIVGILLIAFVVSLVVVPALILAWRLRNEQFVAGGSWGRQIFGWRKEKKQHR
jgi:hypothetical protein